eukprot:Tamp_05540.p1 GENE.Tamp_05540~~Tamp_05540.p1  ORF type:complete len:766 (+),score=153.71 Tamp_05540:289-2298(+)
MTAEGAAHRELPGALSNLGVLLKEHGLILAAEQCYRLATRLEPRNAGHHYRMGNARLTRQELELARQAYMRATRHWATFGDAYNNLGNCLMGMSRFRDAAAAYEYAVKSSPKNANYLVNLGGVRSRDDLSGAIEMLERALAIQPNFGEAWNNLANLYRDQGSLDKAAAAYEEAHKFMRGSGEVLVNLASVRGYLCEWRGRDKLLQQIVALSEQQLQQGAKVSLSPFYANTFGCTPDVLLALARYQARSTAAAVSYLLPLPNWQQPTRLGGPRSRMRVGILSSDLTNHIVGHGTASLLALWKQQRQPIDVYAFALTPSDQSAPRAALEELAHAFVTVHDAPSLDIAREINQQQLHVLLELNGHTKGNRFDILALQPAAVQILFHGYAGTSGAEFMSHIVADAIVLPPELAAVGFAEHVLYLPHPLSFFLIEHYQELEAPELSADPEPAQQLALEHVPEAGGGVRVACFNNLYKVTPDTFAAWMRVLKAEPAAILWLLRMPGAALPRLLAEMAAAGVKADRLLTSELFPRAVHLKVKSAATLFLDTLAYNAHSSAADSLAAGVPVVTCAGAAMPSRVASSLVMAAGMQITIARTVDDYVDIALRALRGGGRVARTWRTSLVHQRSRCPLLDRGRWARGFAAVLKQAAMLSAANSPPVHIIAHANSIPPHTD